MEFWRKPCRAAVAGSRKVGYLGWRDLSPGLERTLSSEVLLLNLVSGGPAPCYCLCVEAGGVGHACGLCVCCTTRGHGWGRLQPRPSAASRPVWVRSLGCLRWFLCSRGHLVTVPVSRGGWSGACSASRLSRLAGRIYFLGKCPFCAVTWMLPGDRSRSLEAPGALSEARGESRAPVC